MTDIVLKRFVYIVTKMLFGYNDEIYEAVKDMICAGDTRSYVNYLKKINKKEIEKGTITEQDIENRVEIKRFKKLDKIW